MKNCYLDANVLIYYKNEDSPYFVQSKRIIEGLVKENCSIVISPLVLDEFLYGLMIHLRRIKIKRTTAFTLLKKTLKEVLSLPNLIIINPPVEKEIQLNTLMLMERFCLLPRDAYHLLIMQEGNIDYFATFDNDFEKVFKKGMVKKYSVGD